VTPILIIGGGVTGAASAWHLAKAGHAVRLIERHQIAAMASGWTLGGVRQSGRDPAELPLAQAAITAWPGLAEALKGETGYTRDGNLRLARNPAEAKSIAGMVAQQRARGLNLTYLPTSAAVRTVAPAISEAVVAASFCPSDGYADPVATTESFARAAERHGATIETGVAALNLVMRNGRIAGVETGAGFIAAETVVLAAGTHSATLLATAGEGIPALPLSIQQVQVVLTEPAPRVFKQVFGVANANCAGRQQPDGRFRFTSGIGAYRGDPEAWSKASLTPPVPEIAGLRALVGRVLPAAAATKVEKSWGGLIDMTPDGLPVIDAPKGLPGLVIAAGFSGHGFGIAPAVGRLVAALALGEAPFLDLAAFRLARFAGRTAPAAPLSLHG
jgi:sarcosine oxidase subunit beta